MTIVEEGDSGAEYGVLTPCEELDAFGGNETGRTSHYDVSKLSI